MKVISSSENRGTLLKETFREITSQEQFLNFLRPLTTSGLLLIRSLLTPLGKSVLVPLGLTTAASATDTAIPKKTGSGTTLEFSNE